MTTEELAAAVDVLTLPQPHAAAYRYPTASHATVLLSLH
jgi:hypothetical protein